MSSDEGPDEFTVIMRILDIVDKSLENSSSREMDQNQRSQFVQIIGKISNSTLSSPLATSRQGELTGDEYVVEQAGAVGPSASAQGMSFWAGPPDETFDLVVLATELVALRAHLRQCAESVEQDEAVTSISRAQVAAAGGDGAAVRQHLKIAGPWALEGAVAIGTHYVARAIRAFGQH